jgi:glycosyltransferase involved in cell wall biosynthesis
VLPRLPALQEVVGATATDAASLFYTPGDAADFAAGVNELLTDDARRREMGRIGQQRVVEQFEWRALTGEIARLCEEYISS